jgi:hypothetical protein
MTPKSKYPSNWRKLRATAYRFCTQRDGELCSNCHKRPVKIVNDPPSQCKQLDVDHRDGNARHNPPDGSNWQLLCHKCNCLKRSEEWKNSGTKISMPPSLLSLREREREGLIVKYMEMEKNLLAENEFHRFVDTQIKRLGTVKKRLLLDAAANDFRLKTDNTISQQALSRYLDKRTNPINGDLQAFKDSEEDWAIRLRG